MQPGETYPPKSEAPSQSFPRTKTTVSLLVWGLIFGLAYTQAPLYYSNQNQYFLHGLAQAGEGFLDQDWLANTADPTPIFTAVVRFTHRHLSDTLFYVYFLVALGVYFHALVGLVPVLGGPELDRLGRLCLLTLLVAVHAGLLRLASVHLFGKDYPWYLQAGVAGQYLLGPVLQPSVSGVLLLASVPIFLRGQPWLAVSCACLAAIVHTTYLLGAAFFVLAYFYDLYTQQKRRTAFLAGAWALVLVSPVLVYNIVWFAPSSAETFAEAQHILVHFRIPHHAIPARWCDSIALLQVGWIVAALFLIRRSRLARLLIVPFALGVLLTLLQVATGSDTLALLFPWRISTVLVPVATTILLARLVQLTAPWLAPHSPGQVRAVQVTCGVLLVGVVVGGIAINSLDLAYPMSKEELPLLDYVRTHKQSGDVYLLPVEMPKVGTGSKGVISTSFTPPPKRGTNGNLISVDLLRFRLLTGAPIFIDFKSIPYKDVEVLQWRQRLDTAHRWYQEKAWDHDTIRAELARHQITHVVTTAADDLHIDALQQVYQDTYYRVYRLRPFIPHMMP
jgi:hypothetical protein